MKPTAQLQVALNETRSVPLVILAVFGRFVGAVGGESGLQGLHFG